MTDLQSRGQPLTDKDDDIALPEADHCQRVRNQCSNSFKIASFIQGHKQPTEHVLIFHHVCQLYFEKSNQVRKVCNRFKNRLYHSTKI